MSSNVRTVWGDKVLDTGQFYPRSFKLTWERSTKTAVFIPVDTNAREAPGPTGASRVCPRGNVAYGLAVRPIHNSLSKKSGGSLTVGAAGPDKPSRIPPGWPPDILRPPHSPDWRSGVT